MNLKVARFVLFGAVLGALAGAVRAEGLDTKDSEERECANNSRPRISFIDYTSPNIGVRPVSQLKIKGKLSIPASRNARSNCREDEGGGMGGGREKLPAVLILHGSAGVDSRGDFYEKALNAAGIATLQIDMWEARNVSGLSNRPQLPLFTYPDAFGALAFLSKHRDIDPNRIGVLGFSWGGVVSLAASEQLYVAMFGDGHKFKAHVANYPICYGANNAALTAAFGLSPAQAGAQYINLTGAPVLIQIGSKDGYDNGTAHCVRLAESVNPSNNNVVSVNQYEGDSHAWDRLMVPTAVQDKFGNEGSAFTTHVIPSVQHEPDVANAYLSRSRVVTFFRKQL